MHIYIYMYKYRYIHSKKKVVQAPAIMNQLGVWKLLYLGMKRTSP